MNENVNSKIISPSAEFEELTLDKLKQMKEMGVTFSDITGITKEDIQMIIPFSKMYIKNFFKKK